MRKPRVAILDNSIDVTGALNAILGYAEYARTDFYFLFILPKNSKASKRLRDKGFEVIEFSFLEISRNWKSLLLYFPQLIINGFKLKEVARKENINIIHVNDFYNMSGIVAKALGGSFKLLTHVRFMPNKFPSLLVNGWMKANLTFAEAIICVSYAVKSCLRDHPKVKVIYDGLPSLKIQLPKNLRENDYIKLLYLGHYIQGKGQNFALEAFSKAFRENPNMRLKFVGGDMGLEKNKAFKEQLRARVKDLGLEEVVEFANATTDVDMEMASADIVVNFSESESFSMTCLEALGSGLPLIASDCGGPAELFEHEISGLLVANKDVEAMCRAILHLAGDQGKRLKFHRNSVIYVKRKFSPKFSSHKLAHLYKKALKG